MFFKYKYFREDKVRVLSKLQELLEREEKVLLAVIFGSFVDLESYRDIDIAVYSKDESLDFLAKLGAKLELELKIPVDVVPLRELEPRFRRRVLIKGIVVVEKQPGLYEALLSLTLDELKLLEIACYGVKYS